MTDRDPISRLEALGRVPVPPPSDELVGRVQPARLPRRERTRPAVRFPVVLPAAALAAAILGFVLVAVNHGSSTSTPTVVLENAVDSSVEAGGATAPARPGATLPDGAVVSVGPTGSVKVGPVTLGPGERAVVRAGRLQRLRAAAKVAPEWERLPVAVELQGRRTPRGVVTLKWAPYAGTGAAARYVVFREDRTVVARRAVGGRLAAADTSSPADGTRYLVVVLDAQGVPLARSQLVSV